MSYQKKDGRVTRARPSFGMTTTLKKKKKKKKERKNKQKKKKIFFIKKKSKILFFQKKKKNVKSRCHTKRRAGAATRTRPSCGTQGIRNLFA